MIFDNYKIRVSCKPVCSFSFTSCDLYKQCYCVLFFNSHVEDTTNAMVLSYSSEYQPFKYLYIYIYLINLAEPYDSPLSLYQTNTIAHPLCSFKIALPPHFSHTPLYINNDRSLRSPYPVSVENERTSFATCASALKSIGLLIIFKRASDEKVTYFMQTRHNKNRGNYLVRSAIKTNHQPNTFQCARARSNHLSPFASAGFN